MKRALAALVLVGMLGRAGGVRADECGARLAWLDEQLGREGHRARVWSWSWGLVLGASTVGSLAAVPFVADEERPDWYVNAFTSGVGMLPLLVAPLEVMHDARELHDELAGLPADADRCALVTHAEARLVRDADGEADGRAWWNHALNVALNGGAGLFLGLVYDRWQSGILTAVIGSAVGEAMILTQPVGALEDREAYRGGAIRLTVIPVTQDERFSVVLMGSF